MRAARREKDGRREGESARVCERVRACPFECVRCFQLENGVCARAPTERIKKKFTVWICRGRTCVPGFWRVSLWFLKRALLCRRSKRARYWHKRGQGGGGGDESNDKIAFFANESCVKGRYGNNGFRGLISLSVWENVKRENWRNDGCSVFISYFFFSVPWNWIFSFISRIFYVSIFVIRNW